MLSVVLERSLTSNRGGAVFGAIVGPWLRPGDRNAPCQLHAQARDRHDELRALVERGQSPAKARRALLTEQKLAGARRLTFRAFAQRWVDETLFYRSVG